VARPGRLAIVALLLAPAAARAAHGRVTLDLLAGGGWTSDVFVGAGLGPDGVALLEPALRLDLAFSPAWKGAARLEARAGTHLSSGFAAGGGGGEAEARWVGQAGEASVALGGDWIGYTTGAPLDLATPAAPAVLGSRALRLRPAARLRALGLTLRAALPLAWVASEVPEGGDVTERDVALVLGAGRALGPVTASAAWRLARAGGTRADFAFTANALLLAAEAAAGPVGLQARLELQAARYRTAARERLLRAALVASAPLGRRCVAEATWSFVASRVTGPAAGDASRHLLLLGVRVQAEPASW
jgi:hypothetical protein